MLIDHTYFVGDISLPMNTVNYSETETSGIAYMLQTVGQYNIQTFLDQFEISYLEQLFGVEMTQAFYAGSQETVIEERWDNLRNKLVRQWENIKVSPIAYFAYYWIKRYARTKSTIAGEVDLNFTEGENSDDSDKLILAWNKMVAMNFEILKWVYENADEYPEFIVPTEFRSFIIGDIFMSGALFEPFCNNKLLQKINNFGI